MYTKVSKIARWGLFFIITVLFFAVFPIKETATASTLPTLQKIALPLAKNIAANLGNPVRVIIPSLNLNSPVQAVGKDQNGNMAVPNGKTKNVGWYKYGTVPGNIGTSVFDAHVFAAFNSLKDLKPGDDIFVITDQNQKLDFKVSAANTYALASLSASTLFGQNGNIRELNLITCAGKLTADKSTYDHRLIVFTKFASIEAA